MTDPEPLREALRADPEPPSGSARDQARQRLDSLAVPPGALGRLGELAVDLAAMQDRVPPRAPQRPGLVILAGDHGVAAHGVSAAPPQVTAAMMPLFVSRTSGATALAAAQGVSVRAYDLGVDADLSGLGPEVVEFKVNRGAAPLHLTDALTPAELDAALDAGVRIATREIEAGVDLLIPGDMGIGNTTPSAALIAAVLGLAATDVVGAGTGIDHQALAVKTGVVGTALDRVRAAHGHAPDPWVLLAALGSADLAANVAMILTATRAGVPVLLDGVIAGACAVLAQAVAPGVADWLIAGSRSTEPAHAHALRALGKEPLLDLGLRLGEGSGALAALGLLTQASTLLRDVGLLSDVLGGGALDPGGVGAP